MSRQATTLDWLDRPFLELVRLAWPIAISMISYSLMTFVGTWFVSVGIGPSALAGVGLGGVAAFTLLCFTMGLMQGVKVLVSQAMGADRSHEAGAYLGAGLVLALGLGLIAVALGFVLAPLVSLLAASEEAGAHASLYMRIRILSSPIMFAFLAVREASYGRGQVRAPMIASVLGNAANILFDYLFVMVLDWGVAGAGWGAVIANTVEACVAFGLQYRLVREIRAIRLEHVLRVLRMGIPTGGQFLLEFGAFAMLTALISAMSEVQMAAHQIVLQVLHLAFLPANAVAEAGSVLAGQAVGANRDDLVPGVARRALLVAGSYALLCTLTSVVGARLIVSGFTSDPALIGPGIQLMHIAAVFLIVDAANMVARSILRGTGDVRFAAVVGILFSWGLTPPTTWLLGHHMGLQASGGWIGLCFEIFAGASVMWWRLRSKGWHPAAARSRAELASMNPLAEQPEPAGTPGEQPPATAPLVNKDAVA